MNNTEINGINEIVKLYRDEPYNRKSIVDYINNYLPEYVYNNKPITNAIKDVLAIYYKKMFNKVNLLCAIVNDQKLNEEYKKILVGYHIPYKNEFNDYDKSCLEFCLSDMFFFRKKDINYVTLSDPIYYFKGNNTNESIKNVVDYINYYGYRMFDTRLFKEKEAYQNMDIIQSNFEQYKNSNYSLPEVNGENKNLVIGRYGEYLVYKEELNKYKNNPDIDVLWVSNCVGDGFGYDIMVINKKTMDTKLIEVKSSASDYLEYERSLTFNESHTLRKYIDSPNTSYELRLIYLPQNDDVIMFNYEHKSNDIYTVSSNFDNLYDEISLDLNPSEIAIPIPQRLKSINSGKKLQKIVDSMNNRLGNQL